jgi:hypothetical protein
LPRACRGRDCSPRSSPANTPITSRSIVSSTSANARVWCCRARRCATG